MHRLSWSFLRPGSRLTANVQRSLIIILCPHLNYARIKHITPVPCTTTYHAPYVSDTFFFVVLSKLFFLFLVIISLFICLTTAYKLQLYPYFQAFRITHAYSPLRERVSSVPLVSIPLSICQTPAYSRLQVFIKGINILVTFPEENNVPFRSHIRVV